MKPRLANSRASVKARPGSGEIVSAVPRQLLSSPEALFKDVREMILAAREGVAQAVNAGLVTLYWQIGKRIRKDVLQEKRAEYGQKIVAAIALALGPRDFAIVMRAVVTSKVQVDNKGALLLFGPQSVGTSFIYSPPHTPKGPGRGYSFQRRERLNAC